QDLISADDRNHPNFQNLRYHSPNTFLGFFLPKHATSGENSNIKIGNSKQILNLNFQNFKHFEFDFICFVLRYSDFEFY
ncbi:hypothetical protein COV40_01510, partial [Candidatus Berkelbacteria bacterium CG11_big_fil_rev_8_21_14_0_20_42_15]